MLPIRTSKWLWMPLFCIAVSVLAMAVIYFDVDSRKAAIYEQVAAVPSMPAAIVFGAGIRSQAFRDRVATAVSLYKSGKVRKLLMTGDNRHVSYNEPIAMKKAAVAQGIPEGDIVCDFAGLRTYDSLYRARDIFGVRQAILVSQRYHLPRAIFLAQRLGLKVVGIDATLGSYGAVQYWYDLREFAASEAAWLDVVTGRKPRYLGKKEPLFPEQHD